MKDNLGLIAVLGAAGLVAWYWWTKQPQDSSMPSAPTKYTGPGPSSTAPEPDYGFSVGPSIGRDYNVGGFFK